MTDAADPAAEPDEKKSGFLFPLLLAMALAAGGFGFSYFDYWSPAELFQKRADNRSGTGSVVFVDIPAIEITMPGARKYTVLLAATLEVDVADRKAVESLMPRILDAMNGFLTAVDPAAYDKRGVLEIIRAELTTRIRHVLGETPVRDVLITEFRIK